MNEIFEVLLDEPAIFEVGVDKSDERGRGVVDLRFF